MSRECVRCIVQLGLNELHWKDGSGSPIHLDGPPVFLRACLLGQLQHSHLHRPLFPLHLHQTLTFDRVFTNCTKSYLLKEVVTGEHVRIEMIQVSEDYTGGKILARYETPAHTFLFPDPPTKEGELRVAALCKSRKYQHPPQLTFTSSTTLTTVTTHTTLSKPSLWTSDKHTNPLAEIYSDPPPSTPPILTQNKDTTTRDKLHALLGSYTKPHPPPASEKERKTKPRMKIKFKPPVPKFTHSKRSEPSDRGKGEFPSPSKPLYHCCTASLGPHGWETCPQRSQRKTAATQQQRTRSRSLPPSPRPKRSCLRHKPSHTLSHSIPWTTQSITTAQASSGASGGPQPPFVAGRADPRVLGKRDFCGQSPMTVVRHFSTAEGKKGRKEGWKEGGGWAFDGGDISTGMNQFSTEKSQRIYSQWLHGGRGAGMSHPGVHQHHPLGGDDRDSHEQFSAPHTTAGGGWGSEEESESSEESSTGSSPSQEGSKIPHEEASRTPSPLTHNSPQPPLSTNSHLPNHPSSPPLPPPPPPSTTHLSPSHPLPRQPSAHQELLYKYLEYQPGNRRGGMASPARVIVDKLERLIQECSDCRHTAESLGEDDLSEDLARLKASLSAEREDALNRSARMIPQQSILVKLGARGEDYWSRRAAEFQGKPHRLVFNETLEKIYHRLYQNATQIH